MSSLSPAELKLKNFTDLTFAVRLLQDDFAAGMYRLGITEETAKQLLALSPSQVERLASADALLFGPRFNSDTVMSKLTEFAGGSRYSLSHAMLCALGSGHMKAAQIEEVAAK